MTEMKIKNFKCNFDVYDSLYRAGGRKSIDLHRIKNFKFCFDILLLYKYWSARNKTLGMKFLELNGQKQKLKDEAFPLHAVRTLYWKSWKTLVL